MERDIETMVSLWLLQRIGLGTKQTPNFKGIDHLKDKWTKCIEIKGVILTNNVETIIQSVS